MPVKKEREYRTLVTPLTAQVASDGFYWGNPGRYSD